MRVQDIMILPGNHEPTREFVKFILPILGLAENQIIWTSGENFALDEDINENIQKIIQQTIKKSVSDYYGCNWVLVPYSATKYFLHWSSVLSQEFPYDHNSCVKNMSQPTLEVFGESEEWIEKYGHKGILHRHMSNLNIPAIIEDIDENLKNFGVPKGYQCSNNTELLGAYNLLKTQTSSNKAVIKPIYGTAGYGIIFIDTENEILNYDFPMGEVLLEEMLNLDYTDDGLVISPAVHYFSEEIFGGKLVDQLMRNTTYLGWRESKANIEFQNVVMGVTEKLISYMKPKVRMYLTLFDSFFFFDLSFSHSLHRSLS